jgi:hypothetical protein
MPQQLFGVIPVRITQTIWGPIPKWARTIRKAYLPPAPLPVVPVLVSAVAGLSLAIVLFEPGTTVLPVAPGLSVTDPSLAARSSLVSPAPAGGLAVCASATVSGPAAKNAAKAT